MRRISGFERAVYAACSRIPRGRVATYAGIARAIGKPGAARAVGNALNRNRSPGVPCHRVVRSDGRVGGFAWGAERKARMLRAEGIRIRNGTVDMAAFSRRKGSS
jgi:O-6-methylguanine DNA methyltransferase